MPRISAVDWVFLKNQYRTLTKMQQQLLLKLRGMHSCAGMSTPKRLERFTWEASLIHMQ
jgi:hypothetical protein